MMKEHKHLLALDVGTRKVTGILLEQSENGYTVCAAETMEHRTRAMLDGQIHDIPKVAEVVSEVRRSLEEKTECKIHSAAVAAAGRSLCTYRGSSQIPLFSSQRITKESVLRLEYAAVHQAQQRLLSGPAGRARFAEQYNCVGYSVVHYELDGSAIGNPVGQRGSTVSCEVIATFLPRVVVDSLRGVLELAGLKLQSLTLEPIAALRMVVPESMRRLNVALVDIGAGTSDIAITRDGTIVAYDMVPVAGDEISEALTEQLLLDFMTAEDVKRKLNKKGQVAYKNILGEKVTQPAIELRSVAKPAVEMLVEKISRAILNNNGGAPQAVFCVGGGSLTPELTDALAEKLAMDSARVAIKGKEMLGLLPNKSKKYQGPELVTPLGIAHTAISGDALKFYRVEVNKQPVDVMDLGCSRVSDALLAAGIGSRELVGPPGKGLSVEVNGQVTVIAGDMGEMAEIRVNGETVSLEAQIEEGDRITFVAAKAGEDARATVASLLARSSPFSVTVNGTQHRLQPPVFRGQERLTPETELGDRDKVRVLKTMPLSWVLEELGMTESFSGGSIQVTVNQKEKQIPFGPRVLRINGKPAVPQSDVSDGDVLEITDDGTYPTVSTLTEHRPRTIEISVNEKITTFPVKEVNYTLNGRKVPGETPLSNGDRVDIQVIDHNITLADILHIINFETNPPAGRNTLMLRVNGREAEFTTQLKHGDRLEVGWSA